MNENDLRVIKTKQALHRALLLLLKTKTLESISISALCREAKVNRGTFYLHYKDIAELFYEHLHHLLQDLEDSFYEPYRQDPHLKTNKLNPSTIRIFHHVKTYQSFYEIVFDKNSSLSYYYSLFDKIKSLIQDSTNFSQTSSLDIALLLSYQTNAIMGLLIEWSENGFANSPEYMSEQLSTLIRLKH